MMKTDAVMISNNSKEAYNATFCLVLDRDITQRQTGVIGLLLGLLNVFCGLLGFLLNLWFVITFVRHRSVRKKQNIVLFGLSISDLLSAICVQILFGLRLSFESSGNYENKCWMVATTNSSLLMFSVVTVVILTLMSIERYFAVFHERFYSRHLSQTCLTVIIISIWIIIATAASIISAKRMTLNTSVVLGYGSLVVLTTIWNMFAYSKILWIIKSKTRTTLALERRLHGQILSYKQARRSYKCVAILVVFITTYMPCVLLMFVLRLGKLEVDVNVVNLTFTIVCLTSSINPCLYLISSPSLRSKMMETLPLRKTKATITPCD